MEEESRREEEGREQHVRVVVVEPLPSTPSTSSHLVLGVLRQQVQRAHRQPELAGVRQLADAVAQVDQLVAGDLVKEWREER
jgi:hypothetical protein